MDNSTAPPAPSTVANCTDDSIAGGLCYQIIPSSQLKTSLWISAIGGALCLIAFAFLRGIKTWKPIYHKRATQISDLLCRPAPLRLSLSGGLQRLWSYLTPALTYSDAELLATAGLDTLILIRLIQMGIQMFFPLAAIGCAVLLPIYHTGDALTNQVSNNGSVNADSFMKNTLSNVSYGSPRLWAPWCIMLVVTVWCLWCLWAHCRSYAALQSLHTHAAVLIQELDSKTLKRKLKKQLMRLQTATLLANKKKQNGASAGGGGVGGENAPGDDTAAATATIAGEFEFEEEEEAIPIVGFMRMVGTSIARDKKYGPGAKGWWRAARKLLWQSVNPMAMLKSDVELVELCVERMDQRLTQLKKEVAEQKNAKKRKSKESCGSGGGGDFVSDGVSNDLKTAAARDEDEVKTPFLNPRSELQLQDWGPAVHAEVPEIVCPWWLNIEDTPAAVNPVLQGGGGVLLGKTSPHLRSRIQAYRGSMPMWAPASSFVVLFRAGGPTPTDHWDSLLSVSDRLHIAERKLEVDTEELLGLESSSGDGTDAAASTTTITLSGGGSGGLGKEERKFSKGLETLKTKLGVKHVEKRLAAGQALEKALRKLYPKTFQELVSVYNHIPADKAMQKWDHTAGALARVEKQITLLKQQLKSGSGGSGGGVEGEEEKLPAVGDVELGTINKNTATPLSPLSTIATKRAAKKAQKAAQELENLLLLQEQLTAELAHNESDLATARAACLASPLGTAYFALFTCQRDARAAAAGHIGATPLMNMTSEMAPGPDDVNWQGLWAGWRERALRTAFYCTLPMVVIILFPIGPLTGALTNLSVAVCGSGTSANTRSNWAWFCEGPEVLAFLITVVLPITISTFWDTWVMPMVLFIVCQAQRSHASFSNLDKAVVSGFYAFSFINTFIGAVLGGSFLQQLGAALSDGDIFTLVGTALPAASNFFLNYIGVHALFTNLFRFIWPHDGTVLFVFFRYFGWCLPGCERDEWVIRSTPSYRSGRHYGAFLATYIMAFCYAAVAPLILPITALYFFTAFITWRYSAIHFYEPCYDGGGRIFELTYTLTLITLIIANIFAAAVIMTKGLFWIGGSLIVVSVTIIIVFWRYCNDHVMRYIAVVPMQVSEISPTAVVPRECYLPPVLRRGAVGWFPEGGKIWEKYGLPKFVF